MKIFLSLFLFIGMVLMLASCTKAERTVKNVDGTSFDIIEVDSCEYIIGDAGYQGYMAHKGNCKYCEQRIRELWKKK